MTHFVATHPIGPGAPPVFASGWRLRMRKLFFGSLASTVVTVALALASGWLAW
ncbi:MAG: hypothetical protein JWQ76_5397, partial [Ramlibacter sp.]|nr:hypothetical protein [Ramlibacter sp.]